MEDEDEASIDAELRRLGVELPDVETDGEGWDVPPRIDDYWGDEEWDG